MSSLKRFPGHIALLAAVLSGCSSLAVIENVQHAPPAPGIEIPSAHYVRSAIERAAGAAGWKITDVSADRMSVQRSEKRRRVVLAVTFDANHYALRYQDSEGFSYRWSPVADYGGTIINGERGKIHRDYNDWVRALDQAIQTELADAPTASSTATRG